MIKNFIVKFQQNAAKIKFCQQTRNVSQMLAPTNVSREKQNSQSMEKYHLGQEQIEEAVKARPILSNISPEMWINSHKTFVNHGFSTDNFLRIVVGNPRVLTRSSKKNVQTLEQWRLCQFGEYFLFLLITKYPFLMDIDNEMRFKRQIAFLLYHVNTNKNVWKLLMNCPTLIQEPEEVIEAKISYLKEKMRIEVPEIIKSEVLGKSLDEIKCRHVFTERLGIFKPRPLKANPNEKSKNPRLYKITDTSEKSFATKVCYVTLAEYEAFKELFARHLEKTKEEESLDADHDLLSDEEN